MGGLYAGWGGLGQLHHRREGPRREGTGTEVAHTQTVDKKTTMKFTKPCSSSDGSVARSQAQMIAKPLPTGTRTPAP